MIQLSLQGVLASIRQHWRLMVGAGICSSIAAATGVLLRLNRGMLIAEVVVLPRFSTASELMSYARRAGFQEITAHPDPPLVIVTGIRRAAAVQSVHA